MTTARLTISDKAIKRLSAQFAGSVAVETAGFQTNAVVEKRRLRDILLFLKKEEGLAYSMLTDLFVVDHHPKDPRFEIVYLLTSWELKDRVVVKVRLVDGERMPTVSDLFDAANWLEREAYDMFGVRFDDHPHLRGSSWWKISTATPCARISPRKATDSTSRSKLNSKKS